MKDSHKINQNIINLINQPQKSEKDIEVLFSFLNDKKPWITLLSQYFQDLDQSQVRHLVEIARIDEYEQYQTVLEEDDQSKKELYLLMNGELSVFKRNKFLKRKKERLLSKSKNNISIDTTLLSSKKDITLDNEIQEISSQNSLDFQQKEQFQNSPQIKRNKVTNLNLNLSKINSNKNNNNIQKQYLNIEQAQNQEQEQNQEQKQRSKKKIDFEKTSKKLEKLKVRIQMASSGLSSHQSDEEQNSPGIQMRILTNRFKKEKQSSYINQHSHRIKQGQISNTDKQQIKKWESKFAQESKRLNLSDNEIRQIEKNQKTYFSTFKQKQEKKNKSESSKSRSNSSKSESSITSSSSQEDVVININSSKKSKFLDKNNLKKSTFKVTQNKSNLIKKVQNKQIEEFQNEYLKNKQLEEEKKEKELYADFVFKNEEEEEEQRIPDFISNNFGKEINQMKRGAIFGEKALIYRDTQKRTASVISMSKVTQILVLDLSKFKFLNYDFDKFLQEKQELIHESIPNSKNIENHKLRKKILFSFVACSMFYNNIVTNQGTMNDKIYLIQDGECQVHYKDPQTQHIYTVCNIGKGGIIGEEILFHSKSIYQYTVQVTTQHAKLYYIQKKKAKELFVGISLADLKVEWHNKKKSRNQVIQNQKKAIEQIQETYHIDIQNFKKSNPMQHIEILKEKEKIEKFIPLLKPPEVIQQVFEVQSKIETHKKLASQKRSEVTDIYNNFIEFSNLQMAQNGLLLISDQEHYDRYMRNEKCQKVRNLIGYHDPILSYVSHKMYTLSEKIMQRQYEKRFENQESLENYLKEKKERLEEAADDEEVKKYEMKPGQEKMYTKILEKYKQEKRKKAIPKNDDLTNLAIRIGLPKIGVVNKIKKQKQKEITPQRLLKKRQSLILSDSELNPVVNYASQQNSVKNYNNTILEEEEGTKKSQSGQKIIIKKNNQIFKLNKNSLLGSKSNVSQILKNSISENVFSPDNNNNILQEYQQNQDLSQTLLLNQNTNSTVDQSLSNNNLNNNNNFQNKIYLTQQYKQNQNKILSYSNLNNSDQESQNPLQNINIQQQYLYQTQQQQHNQNQQLQQEEKQKKQVNKQHQIMEQVLQQIDQSNISEYLQQVEEEEKQFVKEGVLKNKNFSQQSFQNLNNQKINLQMYQSLQNSPIQQKYSKIQKKQINLSQNQSTMYQTPLNDSQQKIEPLKLNQISFKNNKLDMDFQMNSNKNQYSTSVNSKFKTDLTEKNVNSDQLRLELLKQGEFTRKKLNLRKNNSVESLFTPQNTFQKNKLNNSLHSKSNSHNISFSKSYFNSIKENQNKICQNQNQKQVKIQNNNNINNIQTVDMHNLKGKIVKKSMQKLSQEQIDLQQYKVKRQKLHDKQMQYLYIEKDKMTLKNMFDKIKKMENKHDNYEKEHLDNYCDVSHEKDPLHETQYGFNFKKNQKFVNVKYKKPPSKMDL